MSRSSSSGLKWMGIAFALALAGLIFSAWILRAAYGNRLRQQIWPTSAPEITPLTGSSPGSAPTVLLLGDSRIAQWGLPRLTGWRVVNAGVGGLTTGQLRLAAPQLLEEVRPDTVVLEAGINDLKYLGLHPEMDSQIVPLVASNIAAIIHECVAHGCKVVLLKTWPVGRPSFERRLVWNPMVSVAVGQVNLRLLQLDSPGQGIDVVDLLAEAGLKPGAGSYLDVLHFKPEVYEQLTVALKKELDTLPPPAHQESGQ